MRITALIVALSVSGLAFCGEEEDIAVLGSLTKRFSATRNDGWLRLAVWYARRVMPKLSPMARRRLASIMLGPAKYLADTAANEAEARKYRDFLASLQKIGGLAVKVDLLTKTLALLERKVETVISLPKGEEKTKRVESLKKEFEKVSKEAEELIKALRKDLASKYPPVHRLWGLSATVYRNMGGDRWWRECVVRDHWMRDSLELYYAKSLIFRSKLYEGEERKKMSEIAAKKLHRFIEGEPEFRGDTDPSRDKATMEKFLAPWEKRAKIKVPPEWLNPPSPEPRVFFRGLLALARYWMARAYFEAGDLKQAERYAKFAIRTHATQNTPEPDARTIVDARLNSYWLLGRVAVKQGDIDKAIDIYEKALSLSGQWLEPEDEKVEWCYPDILKTAVGKKIALDKVDLLLKKNRFSEALILTSEVYMSERRSRKMGSQMTPLEGEAVRKMALVFENFKQERPIFPAALYLGLGYGYFALAEEATDAAKKKAYYQKALELFRLVPSMPCEPGEYGIYVPEALFNVGYILQTKLNQPLRAGVVYLYFVQRWQGRYSGIKELQGAARAAVACFRSFKDFCKAGKSLYDTAMEMRRKLISGQGPDVWAEMIQQAYQLLKQKNFTAAIDKLEGIPAEYEVKIAERKQKMVFKGFPQVAGYIGQAAVQALASGAAKPRYLLLAADKLKTALKLMDEHEETYEVKMYAKCVLFLARIYLSDEFVKEKEGKLDSASRKKWALEAVKVLRKFTRDKYADLIAKYTEKSMGLKYAVRLKGALVEAYCNAAQLNAAEREFNEMKQKYAKADPIVFENRCNLLIEAFAKMAKQIEATDKVYAESLRRTASRIADAWAESLKARGKFTYSKAIELAHMQRRLGQLKRARAAYREFLRKIGAEHGDLAKINSQPSPEKRKEWIMVYIQAVMGIADAYADEGKYLRAAQELDKLSLLLECTHCHRYFNAKDIPGAKHGIKTLDDWVRFAATPQEDRRKRALLEFKPLYTYCPAEGWAVRCPKCKRLFFISNRKYERMRQDPKERVECPNRRCRAKLSFADLRWEQVMRRMIAGDFEMRLAIAKYYIKGYLRNRSQAIARDRAQHILETLYTDLRASIKFYHEMINAKWASWNDEMRDKKLDEAFKMWLVFVETVERLFWIASDREDWETITVFIEQRNEYKEAKTDDAFLRALDLIPETPPPENSPLAGLYERVRENVKNNWLDKIKEYYHQAKKRKPKR